MKALHLYTNLFFYSLGHFLVDAACIALVLGGIDVKGDLLHYIVLYNVLAFGMQLPFGWISDRLKIPVLSAILGILSLSAGLFLFRFAILATILAGLGNALFHVGGGTISLNYKPQKAALPGVFVSTGGLGLFAGGWLVKLYGFHTLHFLIPLLVTAIILLFLKDLSINYKIPAKGKINYRYLIIVLILITICIRSVVGLSLNFPWKSNTTLLLLLTATLVLGKGLGGFLADYLGWIRVSVGGLVISAVLLFFGGNYSVPGLAGVFFFNLTMPVTLVAVSNLLPGRPGFAFGSTTVALLVGALPTFYGFKGFFGNPVVVFICILISAIILFYSLRKYFKISGAN